MNIVIIEDEMLAFNKLSKLVSETVTSANIIAHLDSVGAAKKWFSENKQPDIIFMDIHLADGSAFDLVKVVKIDCPVIYTTAYDQYAMQAFKTSGIDYLLKPVKKEDLQNALRKIDKFKSFFSNDIEATATPGTTSGDYKKRFVIRFGEHIKTISVDEIAYCFSENKATFARTFENRTLPMDHNLDTLETMLDPQHFFRINRQYIISLRSIDEMRTYSKARVIITLKPAVKEPPIVSSERSAQFKLWLAGEL